MTNRQQIVDCARSWKGVPFIHQGKTRDGVDCYGFILGVVNELGIAVNHTPINDYPRIPDGRMRNLLQEALEPRKFLDRKPGDILVFAWGGEPQHLAILASQDSVIHAYGSDQRGGVVETRLAGRLLDRIRGVYAIPGVE